MAAHRGRGVVVLGMHRSGTSAIAGSLVRLGLHPCREGDRLGPGAHNRRGFWESRSLTRFNERLLEAFDGCWWCPPSPPAGWERHPGLAIAIDLATTLFAQAHPQAPWVWKDPRLCLLQPFWDAVLGPDVPRVLALRHPDEVAASLVARDGMTAGYASALAEHHLRQALLGAAGRAVLITSYDDLLDDPAAWCDAAGGFMADHGLGERPDGAAEVGAFLDADLRHHRHGSLRGAGGDGDRSVAVHAWAMARRGAHDALDVTDVPALLAAHEGLLVEVRRRIRADLRARRAGGSMAPPGRP